MAEFSARTVRASRMRDTAPLRERDTAPLVVVGLGNPLMGDDGVETLVFSGDGRKASRLANTSTGLIAIKKKDSNLFSLLMMNIARELARRLELTDEILLHYIHSHEDS